MHKLTFLLIALLLYCYGNEVKGEEKWSRYDNPVISFLYPADHVISEERNFIKGTNSAGEEVLRITYLNVEKRSPKNIQGYHKTTYEEIKNAWKKRGLNFHETVISGKKCLVSRFDIKGGKSRFNYIVKYKKYFWTLDYYNSQTKHSKKSSTVPEVPKKIIESAVIKDDSGN